MRIERGQTRIALIGERYTIKLPRIYGKTLMSDIKALARNGRLISFSTFQELVLDGITGNIYEYLGSRKLGDVVMPTRFSFLGLINIQDTATPIKEFVADELNFMHQLAPDVVKTSGHTILWATNYGLHNKTIKLIDYGSKELVNALIKNKEGFRKALDTIQNLRAQSAPN